MAQCLPCYANPFSFDKKRLMSHHTFQIRDVYFKDSLVAPPSDVTAVTTLSAGGYKALCPPGLQGLVWMRTRLCSRG